MKTVHIALQGKGGVGKSYVSSLIAQFLAESGQELICIDTDPVNATFSQYEKFGAKRLDIMEGSKINERKFDELMEIILNSNGQDLVIDNGASSFIPLSNYLTENKAIELLNASGHKVIVHPVVTGGQALLDTLNGFDKLASQFDISADIIVWLNEYFGPVAHDGKEFEQMAVYKKHKKRINGIVRIYKQNSDTFGFDVEMMLKKKITFDEAIAGKEFQLMAKQRLKMVKTDLFNQMKVVLNGA